MNTPIYDDMGNSTYPRVSQPETPQPVNPQPNLGADVQAMIAAEVAKIEAKYADKIKALETQLASAGAPFTGVNAEHAAGPSYEVYPTWSLKLQEMARAGQLTEEILSQAGYLLKAA